MELRIFSPVVWQGRRSQKGKKGKEEKKRVEKEDTTLLLLPLLVFQLKGRRNSIIIPLLFFFFLFCVVQTESGALSLCGDGVRSCAVFLRTNLDPL